MGSNPGLPDQGELEFAPKACFVNANIPVHSQELTGGSEYVEKASSHSMRG